MGGWVWILNFFYLVLGPLLPAIVISTGGCVEILMHPQQFAENTGIRRETGLEISFI